MYPFFVALHVLLCLFLISVILLQPGKGGDPGLSFGGGGASTIFGPRGPTNILQRVTSIVAALFLGTTITLALYSSRSMLANANVDDEIQRIQAEEAPLGDLPLPGDALPSLPDEGVKAPGR